MVSKEELESEKELRQKLVDMISGNADLDSIAERLT